MLSKRIPTATRTLTRASLPRTSNNARSRLQNPRFNSTSTTQAAPQGTSPALIGALAGSLATLTIGYTWYRTSGARDLLSATQTTKHYVAAGTKKLQDAAPEPNEALDWLRDTARSYAVFVPGAQGYVDAAFRELDEVRARHGEEVDRIVGEAYEELRDIARNGEFSLLSAEKAWGVLVKHLGRIGELAGTEAQRVLERHPQLKEKVGGNVDVLREYADQYGPEARREVERTWSQIADIVKTGLSKENVEKVQKLVQEKVEKLRRVGEEAWEKGMQRAKPYLEENPKVKKLVESNAEKLKEGNVQELFQKIKAAVESGDTKDLERYVNSAAGKAKESGFAALDQYLGKMPDGDQIVPKLEQLQEVAEKHGQEAQSIVQDAVSEIAEVLRKKSEEAEELTRKVGEDARKKK